MDQQTTQTPQTLPSAPRASRLGPNAMRGITNVIELAVERFAEDLTMADLARAAGMPANSLTRIFNRRYGMSPKRWIWFFRTVLAAELIVSEPDWPLTTVATQCGFNSAAHFSRRFRDIFQETPTQFRATFLATGRRGRSRHAAQPRYQLMTEDAAGAVTRALAKLDAAGLRA